MDVTELRTNADNIVAGDVFTIAGVWQPRPWWKRAWYRVRYFKMLPFVPQQFVIKECVKDSGLIEYQRFVPPISQHSR